MRHYPLAGLRIGGPELSVLATLGITRVPVFKRPRVAILRPHQKGVLAVRLAKANERARWLRQPVSDHAFMDLQSPLASNAAAA